MTTNLLGIFVVTAYCHCAKCNGKAGQPTASGYMPKVGTTIAAPRKIAFNRNVFVESIGWRITQDRTAKKYNGRFDVFMRTHQEAKEFGKKKLKVWIVK